MEDSKVAVLLEDLIAKFRVFGEGLDMLRDEMNQRFTSLEEKLDNHIIQNRRDFESNRQEHQQLMQMVKELDKEVQTEIKRVK